MIRIRHGLLITECGKKGSRARYKAHVPTAVSGGQEALIVVSSDQSVLTDRYRPNATIYTQVAWGKIVSENCFKYATFVSSSCRPC